MIKLDARSREYEIIVVGEEPHVAYNRVGLTSYFDHRKVENLYLNPLDWVSLASCSVPLGPEYRMSNTFTVLTAADN